MSQPLKQFIEQHAQELFYSLRVYVRNAGITENGTLDDVTRAVLSDVVVEALSHEERFDPDRPAMAWLLRIGANVIRRRRDALGKRSQREPLMDDSRRSTQDTEAATELWKRIAELAVDDPEDVLAMEDRVREMLELVSEDDQHVIRLAVLYELDGQDLAHALGVNPGAARMRLHRALRRLGQAWQQHEHQ